MHNSEPTLYDYKLLMWRHKNIFLSVVGITLLSVVFFNEMTPEVFEATVMVNIDAPPEIRGNHDRASYLDAELKNIQGASVMREVAENMKMLPRGADEASVHAIVDELQRRIKAEPSGKASNYITLTAHAHTPGEAVLLTNSLVQSYAKNRRERAAERRKFAAEEAAADERALRRSEEALRIDMERNWLASARPYFINRLMTLQSESDDLIKKYTVHHPEVKKILKKISKTEELLAHLPQQELEFQRLTNETRLRQAAYDELAKKYNEALRAEAAENAAVFANQPAVASKKPVLPRKFLNFTVAALLGMLLGILVVIVAEGMDMSFSTVEDIERQLSLPVMAMVPHIKPPVRTAARYIRELWRSLFAEKRPFENMTERLAFYHPPHASFMEPYFMLWANLKLVSQSGTRPGAVICFTSATKGEGKTLTGINFSFTAAQSGLKTLFIDVDLRFPTAHEIFSVQFRSGLADCLSAGRYMENAVVSLSYLLKSDRVVPFYKRIPRGIENLYLLPAGTSTSNPAEILTPERMGPFLKKAREHYDLIVLDVPPLIPCADALLIGPQTDGVIMVLKAGYASSLMVKWAKDQITNSGAKILGAVLNDVYSAMMEPQYSKSFTYPYTKSSVPAPANVSKHTDMPASASPKKIRILIVEDDAQMRKILNRFIREKYPAAEIYEAEDGVEAVHKIAALSPTLVILDICLPDVNGLQVCSIARRGGNFACSKILAITGLDTETTRRKALEAGADDFLAKPLDLKTTQNKLAKLLNIN